jgi:hypothetical protein
MSESVYVVALEGVVSGLTRNETRTYLLDNFPNVANSTIDAEMRNALRDAFKQGVEREDVDSSWFNKRKEA